MKLLAALVLFSATLSAQIDSISSTASGDTIFFTTWLRPAGSDHGPWLKGYRLDRSGVSLVAQEKATVWRVDRVSSSADGSVVGISRSRPCTSGTPCVTSLQEFSEILTGRWTKDFEGHVDISSNGRFALLRRQTGFGLVPTEAGRAKRLQRVDLQTFDPNPEPLGEFPAVRGRWISDDGTVLGSKLGWTLIPSEGEPTPIGSPG